MPGRYDDDQDERIEAESWADDEEDRDLPQESDLHPDESEDDLATTDCSHCGHEVIHDAVQCPSCGKYVSVEDAPSKNPPWLLGFTLLFVLAALAWALRSA